VIQQRIVCMNNKQHQNERAVDRINQ